MFLNGEVLRVAEVSDPSGVLYSEFQRIDRVAAALTATLGAVREQSAAYLKRAQMAENAANALESHIDQMAQNASLSDASFVTLVLMRKELERFVNRQEPMPIECAGRFVSWAARLFGLTLDVEVGVAPPANTEVDAPLTTKLSTPEAFDVAVTTGNRLRCREWLLAYEVRDSGTTAAHGVWILQHANRQTFIPELTDWEVDDGPNMMHDPTT